MEHELTAPRNILEFQRHDDANTVWSRYYTERADQIEAHTSRIHSSYLSGFRRLSLPSHCFPTVHELNRALDDSGWTVVLVPGYISVKHLSTLLKQTRFPVARGIRSLAQIHHSPIPDALHDIIGHLPLLFHAPFTEFLFAWAEAVGVAAEQQDAGFVYELQERLGHLESIEAAESRCAPLRRQLERLQHDFGPRPSRLAMLSRLYLWTVEFGLLREEGTPRILGAGILSSAQEMANVLNGQTAVQPFGPAVCLEDIDFTGFQRHVYAAHSLGDWRAALDAAPVAGRPVSRAQPIGLC